MRTQQAPTRPALMIAAALIAAGVAATPAHAVRPIVFVHGGSGSGAQFESQAMRYASNGYPPDLVKVYEYDSLFSLATQAQVIAGLDVFIDGVLAETGADKVDLLGHSLGTFVSRSYLSSPERAANVAHYVNIDGSSATALPGGVPTLALWAGADPPVGSITGATNVTLAGHEHIECATSAEAFREMYYFFRGELPATTDIVSEPPGQVSISGQVNFFPSNVGIAGAALEVWEVDGATGFRTRASPVATRAIDATGDWGPLDDVKPGRYYEFSVRREGEVDVRFFYEPFLRSDHLIRLNIATGLAPFIDASPNHVALTVLRQREFCGDLGAASDVLEIDGTDVLNPTTASCASIALGSAAVFLFDDESDGMTHLDAVPFPFGPLAFLTAADLFIPADPPGTLSVLTVPRGGGAARTVHVPNPPSTEARVVVNLNDFEQ